MADEPADPFADYDARKKEVDALLPLLEGPWGEALPRLKRSTTHESEDLRRDVYAMLWEQGRHSQDGPKRQRIVEFMLEGLLSNTSFIQGQLLKWLQDFRAEDFSPQARELLGKVPWDVDEAPMLIRLMGIADYRAALPRLEELAREADTPPASGSWYGTREWAALLVLARWGIGDAGALVVEKVEAEKDPVVQATLLFRDLGYTRHPAAAEALRRALNSVARLPRIKDNVPGRPVALYAAEVMAECLAGFPLQKRDLQEADLRPVRAWANQQQTWKFR
jgi:hypothetical protein